MLAPPIIRREEAAPPSPVSYGWLFSLDAKNAVVTHWSPLPAGDSPTSTKVAGFRIRVLETEGRGGRAQLRSFRAPTSAQRTDFSGQSVGTLAVEADRVVLELGAYEWIQADVRW